jgi:glycosyltransferase involved in cell wall biosynthesis
MRPLVLEIRDIWPESIVSVGAMRPGRTIRFLEWLERRMYRAATQIVAVGEGYRRNISSKVPMSDRISVITNGVDLDTFAPQAVNQQLQEQWNPDRKFICAYIGTVGLAHGLEVVIRAAERLRAMKRLDILFLIVGDGAERKNLESATQRHGLESWIRFTGRLPKHEMPQILALAQCLLVHLRRSELFETVIPSKLFEAMAMERPILLAVRGEAEQIVRQANCGIVIEPENDEQLVEAVIRLNEDSQLLSELSASGRAFARRHYSRSALAEEYLRLLTRIGAPDKTAS